MRIRTAVVMMLLMGEALRGQAGAKASVAWAPWSPAAFELARAQGKLVLVDAEATWCHWCHVMDEKTYGDPGVAALLRDRVVAVKADIDVHPDARELYEDIGWPGTAIYSPAGVALYRHRGYIEAAEFRKVVQGLLADQAAGTLKPWKEEGGDTAPASERGASGPALDRALAQLEETYDESRGGWGTGQKYPIAQNVEAAFLAGAAGKAPAWRLRGLFTLSQQRALTDPVWGGIYQYSVGPTWHDVHFERLAVLQAGYLENLALAHRLTGDGDWVADARKVLGFLARFFEVKEGGYAATMDADLGGYDRRRGALDGHAYYALNDAGRVRRGIPRIDTRRYAQVQGLLIAALASLHGAAPELGTLERARRAAAYAEAKLASGGGYLHGERQAGAFFLGDQAAMLKGLLALHEATGEARWLDRAEVLGRFIEARLAEPSGLFRARSMEPGAAGAFAEVRTPFEDNALLARQFLRLHAFTGEARWKERAGGILAALGTPGRLEEQGRWIGDFTSAALEISRDPAHLTIVGARDDGRTRALFAAALADAAPNRVVVLHDPAEGAPRNPDLGFPALGKPAAFLCGQGTCRGPFADPATLVEDLRSAEGRQGR